VDPRYYQRISSYTRATVLVSIVVSSLLGQLLVDFKVSLTVLLLITTITASLATVLSLFLPTPVPKVVTFTDDVTTLKHDSLCDTLYYLWKTFQGNWMLLTWIVWSSVVLGIHQLVLTYWQNLFYKIDSFSDYNGYIFALAYFLAASASMVPIRLEKSGNGIPSNLGNIFLAVFPFVFGGFLIALAFSTSLVIASVLFVVYHVVFEFMNPILNAKIATAVLKAKINMGEDTDTVVSKPNKRQFGAVFSIATLLQMAIQTIVQVIVGSSGLSLPIRVEFITFGGIMVGMGLIVLFLYGVNCIFTFKKDTLIN